MSRTGEVTVVEATSRQVFSFLGGIVAAMAAVVAILTPIVIGAAKSEAQAAVARQAEVDRAQFVTKSELSSVLRELDQIRAQLDRIEGPVGEREK